MMYVALIRGVGPGNPNMSGPKFTEFFEGLGFTKVKPVIASGNVVFESKETDEKALEDKIEENLPKKLDFSRMTIVRSEEDLKKLVKSDPFKGVEDKAPNYLLVTFFKDRRKEIATVLNMNTDKSTNFMAKMDRDHKKEVTSRTWKTIHRILKAMEQ